MVESICFENNRLAFEYVLDSFFIRPILEEQALLREKLEIKPTWKKGKDPAVKRKTQPMVSDLQVAAMRVK